MNNFKKFIVLLLCAAMLVPMLVACGDKKNDETDPDEKIQYTEIETAIPDDLMFTGEKFNILCREDNAYGTYLYEIVADENETELVNQAIYERNLAVEERFGLEIVAIDIPGDWDRGDDFTNTFKNSIMSGSQDYDLIVSQQAYMAEPGLNDFYLNIYEVPYISDDLDQPYIFSDMVDEMTVNGKLFHLVGDYSLTYWEYLYVLYFNKQLAENENLEDIYQIVRDGQWTIDKCIEMAKGVFRDLDGNGWAGENDQFGYITDYGTTVEALFAQFDMPLSSVDENGEVVLSIDVGKTVSVLEKMIEFFDTDDVYTHHVTSSDTEDENPFTPIFTEDRALFYADTLNKAQKYRGMETDFGIIPYPMWDENQSGYYTMSMDGYSVAVVPLDAPSLEKTGAVIDLLSAISYEKVVPAYYEMALKGKYARDDESGEMLDIIRDGVRVNFGYFYHCDIDTGRFMRVLLEEKNSNFSSYYAAQKKGYERNLRNILKTYADDEEE